MPSVPFKIWQPFIDGAKKTLSNNNYELLQTTYDAILEKVDEVREENDAIPFGEITVRIWIPIIEKPYKKDDGTIGQETYIEKINFKDFLDKGIQPLYGAVLTLIKKLKEHPDVYTKFNNEVITKGSFEVRFDLLYKDTETDVEGCDIVVPKPTPQ